MEQRNPTKIIPSGKVYRQMFDAEVQLVKALEKSRENTKQSLDGEKSTSAGQNGELPLVDAVHPEGISMLTTRQRTWTQGFPNEPHVENPVLYKFYSEEVVGHEPDSRMASKEVRGLPDVLTPAKKGSDIIERIAESRKQRHECAVEDMHQELGVISSELEPRIVERGEMLMEKLGANDLVIEEVMDRISKDEDLMRYSLDDLHTLWEEAASHSQVRQESIHQLDQSLKNIEENRMQMIRDVLKNYAKMLEKIAHLMAPDLQRLLDKESQMINQAVLSNRRAYADLYCRLLMSDVEREKKLHTHWRKRVEDWKKLHTDMAVTRFREYIESEVVVHPSGAESVLEHMRVDQMSFNQRRIDLVNSLRDLKPPASTKTAVYRWNQQVTDVSKEIDQLNQQYFNKLYAEYEKVCQECLEHVDRIKEDLIARGVCTESKAQSVVNELCLPLVGDRQTKFEQALEEMDKSLEEHNSHVLTQLKSLFKFCQGAAHVWDVHEIGLAKQERALQQKLDDCRHTHDNENQEREANLDLLMDKMRQDASEDTLKESLKKALAMLDTIKEGYDEFHGKQQDIVATYPDMVDEELGNYDAAVCRFFTVDRKHPQAQDEEEEKSEEPQEVDTSRKRKKKRRPSSRTEEKPTSPLPLAVGEILKTTKGTTFYVLTVAGEHGIPQEELSEAPPTGKPPYIENVDVSDKFILEVKKVIRLNFLDHLEDWTNQAVDRSKSVVAAKNEELSSELDLRMHLHQPRARRAELDVHNVRAAELVMHGERVSRHCKGITQALNDLKTKFNTMTSDHNTLADKFREDIEALEVIFINATKSSKLVALSNQLHVEQERYMTVIRTSLRQFRQHLDDTLQMLRQSNASFIKSFKVFSDGGNFCPEEIEEYRKRLEKMAQKVDSAEGFIMADLEGMESKRLEQATKIAAEFEDRFKHHMIDLVFMEKIARWLTNTQVKIKAEVADSNTQAQKLGQCLNDLERRIDACEKPNLDKESVSPAQLNESLHGIFESFHDRSHYLHCVKELNIQVRPPSAQTLQGNPALGARVGFTSDTVPAISKPGKQPTEDPSVGVIKNILKTQKTKLRFGNEADMDEEIKPNYEPTMPAGLGVVQEVRERTKSSRQSRPPTDNFDKASKKSSRQGTASISNNDQPKRVLSGNRRLSKGQKYDRKYMVFGEKEEPGEDTHFLGKIRHLLREALDGLLTAAELYYRQKGSRAVTRPQALQESFEQCADIVVAKLQSYFTQADEYHNQCLQELRSQLTKLEEMVAHVPQCIINELLQMAITQAKNHRAQLDKQFASNLKQWDEDKFEHKNLLRPTLGHPQQAEELQELCQREEGRRQQYLQGVEEHTMALQEMAIKCADNFTEQLAKTSEHLLLQFDNLLVVDDVERGRVPPVKYPTSELIRRKNAGQPLEDSDEKQGPPRGKNTWNGVPMSEFVIPEEMKTEKEKAKEKRKRKEKERVPSADANGEGSPAPIATPKPAAIPKQTHTASVTTQKTSEGHNSTIEARDRAYQVYKESFAEILAGIDEERHKQLVAEQRWTDSWLTSVHKVKKLY